MSINQLLQSLPLAAFLLTGPPALAAGDLEALAGQWSVKKVNAQGQDYTQTFTVKTNKFVFQIRAAEDRVVLHAEGDLKLDQLGPFKAAHFMHIRAGSSASDLQDVDDEYASIYHLEGDSWTMASGFDKERDQQPPSLDLYRRVKSAAPAATLVIDEIELADTPQSATWFVWFEAKAEGVTRTYHVAGKGYDKNQVTIPVGLELPGIGAGKTCSFKLQLDDVDEDAATEEADNKSAGEFTVKDKGEQAYKPQDNWRYTIRWHLK